MGFQRTKTLYKAVEFAYSTPVAGRPNLNPSLSPPACRLRSRHYTATFHSSPALRHPVTAQILSHGLANGMVLVGEPTPSLESAAFSFLLPGGCSYDPPGRPGGDDLRDDAPRCRPATAGPGSPIWRNWASSAANRSACRRPISAGPRSKTICPPRWCCLPICCAGRSCRPTNWSRPQRLPAGVAGRRRRAEPEADD